MRTRAKDRIVLANGDVMTLGEAFDRGRVVLYKSEAYSRRKEDSAGRPLKVIHYYAREADTLWDIGEKLYASRGGK